MARKREFDEVEVLDRAILLFLEKGFEAASIHDLKRVMGISTSSMYEVFGDKRGTFLKALARFCELEQARLSLMAQRSGTAIQLIDDMFDSLDDVLHTTPENQGSLAFNTMVEFGTRDPHVTQVIFDHYFKIAGIIIDILRADQSAAVVTTHFDADHLAHLILCTLYGLAAVKRAQPTYAYTQPIKHLVHSLLESSPSA